MIEIYTITHCPACHPKYNSFYNTVRDYCREQGRLDLKVIPLTSTQALQRYNRDVKPYRNGRRTLPMAFDTETKQELLLDGKGKVRSSKVLPRDKQEAEKPHIPRRRRGNPAEAEAALKNWHRKVNDVDMAYADALALGGYEFFRDYCTGAIPAGFAVSIVKALRKREAQHEAKIIQAILNGCGSINSKRPGQILKRTDRALNKEAYGD